ncbi:MAG: ATP-binding cassette domain-containing protein [Gammaproteobacteria bacterium]|nr:ATP-binding cassette domain-containing protein [Gammaproteobacteria bacterium]MCG3143298.1 Tungstate uptake system ATP-binding protein TupC [Gammaproteobacteria bacterium]
MARPAIEEQPAISAGGPSILPLVLRDVCLSAGGRALLDRVNLVLTAGVRTVVLGPNGAGKSLLLRICHGLISPSSGTMEWTGPGATEARVRQAMVFQRPMLLRRSVIANVDYALAVRRMSRALRTTRAREALEMAGLAPLAERPAGVLSGGEQQRVALARAWALDPEVLFLDEPTANLDPAATRAVEEAIAGIARGGTKIVMTTHDLGQARRLAEEIVFLHNGRLLEQRSAAAFFAGPGHEAARAFLRGELLW